MTKDFLTFTERIQKAVNGLLATFLAEKVSSAKRHYPLANELLIEIRRALKGGKRLRPTLAAVGYIAGGGKRLRGILPAAAALEMLHLALLIHDDIFDRAAVRRFQPTTIEFLKMKFGDAHTGLSGAILAGDLARAFADELFIQASVSDRRLKAGLTIFARSKEEVEVGQYLDVRIARAKPRSSKDLLRVLTYKTAKYSFERPLQIGAVLAGAPKRLMPSLSQYALPIGMAFQIQDDILGTFGNERETGKPTNSDIREGKMTLLVIEALRKSKGRERRILIETIGSQHATPDEIAAVKKIFITSGAYVKAGQTFRTLVLRAKRGLERAPFRERSKRLLASFADWLLKRREMGIYA